MLGWFRRHAKILMVVLGSAAMAIFGLGPVFDQLGRGGGGGAEARENKVVAIWKGGQIKRSDLDKWERSHYETQRFLIGVRQAAEKKKGDQVRSLASPIPLLRDEQGLQSAVDEQLVSKFLMSERAKAEGVIVSSGMVDDYIALTSGDAGFSNQDLETINKEKNSYGSLQSIKEHLKFELLAQQMQQYASAAIPMVPNPTEAMELYGRTAEQVECEVLPISVEKFIDQTGDISSAELKKVYDQGKYDFADPRSVRPGFKIGPKVKVQYFKANYETFLTNEMNKLTVPQVQTEYDRLVEEKNPIVMEPVTLQDDSISIPGAPPIGVEAPADGDTPEAPPASDGDTPEPPATTTTSPETTTNPGTATGEVTPPPTSELPTEGGTTLELPAIEVGTTLELPKTPEVKPLLDTPVQGEASEVLKKSSYKISKSKFQFVSTSAQDETAQEATPVTETPVETAPAETTAAPVETAPATTQVAESQAADAPAEPPVTQEGEVGGIGDIMSDLAQTGDDAEDNRKAKPFAEVADAVKRSMCTEAAKAAMKDAMDRASIPVQQYYEGLSVWEDGNQKGEGPALFDAELLAKDYGLTVVETDLVEGVELMDDPIGALGVMVQDRVRGRMQNNIKSVAQMVFEQFDEINLYESQVVNDVWASQSTFCFWLTEKAETRVPEFSDCKDDVEKFIKQTKALEMAMAEAQTKAKEVNDKRSETMGNIFGEQAVPTGAFTWFTSFGEARYSMPNGVTAIGEDFMTTAFGLAKLEAGVAANETKDTVYVIQAITPSRPVSEAGFDFLTNQYFKYKRIPNETFLVGQRYTRELSLTWNQELQDSMGFKFLDR